MTDIAGRPAVITGAASGIGRALAERAAQAGMNVVVADVDEAGLQTVADTCTALGVEVDTAVVDVSSRDENLALADRTFDRFGSPGLLCLNAGVGGGGQIRELTHKDWEWVLGVNLHGVIHGVEAFLDRMVRSGEPGHVVNTASMAGHVSAPGMAPYNVSKYGVVALSETMRGELTGTSVGVSVLCPGWVSTRIHESGRNRPEHLAVDRDPPTAEMLKIMADVIGSGLPPAQVADLVFDAVAEDRFWIFTHDEMMSAIDMRYLELMNNRPSAR